MFDSPLKASDSVPKGFTGSNAVIAGGLRLQNSWSRSVHKALFTRIGNPAFGAPEWLAHLLLSGCITVPFVLLGWLLRIVKHRRFAAQVPSPASVRSVLVIIVDNLGDLVISAGFLRDVRRAYPHGRVTLVVHCGLREFALQCPYVDEVVGFSESGSRYLRAICGPWRALRFCRENLWGRRFDIALNPRWDVDSKHGAMIGLFSLATAHVGFASEANDRKRVINRWLGGAFSHALRSHRLGHDCERGAELLGFMGVTAGQGAGEVWLTDEDRDFADSAISQVATHGLIALGIGASQKKRCWPIDRFLSLAQRILESNPDVSFLIVGNADDALEAERLRPLLGDRLLNRAGECSIARSGALLSKCAVYIGNDSGPMHMAAALGLPVVELSCHPVTGAPDHPNSPTRYHPVGVAHIVLRPSDFTYPCRYACSATVPHCLLSVMVEAAFQAFQEIFAVNVHLQHQQPQYSPEPQSCGLRSSVRSTIPNRSAVPSLAHNGLPRDSSRTATRSWWSPSTPEQTYR